MTLENQLRKYLALSNLIKFSTKPPLEFEYIIFKDFQNLQNFQSVYYILPGAAYKNMEHFIKLILPSNLSTTIMCMTSLNSRKCWGKE